MEESEKPNRYESMMIRITEKDFARPVTDTRDNGYSERRTYVLRVNNALGSRE